MDTYSQCPNCGGVSNFEGCLPCGAKERKRLEKLQEPHFLKYPESYRGRYTSLLIHEMTSVVNQLVDAVNNLPTADKKSDYRILLKKNLDANGVNDVFTLFVEVNGQVYSENKIVREEDKPFHFLKDTDEYVIGSLLIEVGKRLKEIHG